ncbi:MAG: hypothetical protein ACXWPV_00840, partial [Candidatus Limnocylindrales bacterium]
MPEPTATPPASGAERREPTFLDELTRAMHAAAARQREQIVAEMIATATAYEQKAQAHGSTEADELRRLAEQDANEIRSRA